MKETFNIVNGNFDISALTDEAAKEALEQLLSDEILSSIPGFNRILRFVKMGLAGRDYIFLKKISRFVTHISEISTENIQKLIEQLGDEKFRQKVGENLLLLIDRMDDMEKPELAANVFIAYLKNEIDFLDFQKLMTAIDQVKMYSIATLVHFYAPLKTRAHYQFDFDDLHDLTNCGLVGIQLRKQEPLPTDHALKMPRTPEQEHRDEILKYRMEQRKEPFQGYIQNKLGTKFIKIALRGAGD